MNAYSAFYVNKVSLFTDIFVIIFFVGLNQMRSAGEEFVFETLQELLWNHPSQVCIVVLSRIHIIIIGSDKTKIVYHNNRTIVHCFSIKFLWNPCMLFVGVCLLN